MITYEAPVRTAEGLTLDGLKRRFPGVLVWFGRHTGRFWAMVEVRGVPRLVEAVSAERLAEEIDRCRRPPVR
ncbi:hypothetical protein ACQEU3_09010 [Spirillospora sp. CA-253888]